jgi:hypothetical protein
MLFSYNQFTYNENGHGTGYEHTTIANTTQIKFAQQCRDKKYHSERKRYGSAHISEWQKFIRR